MKISKIILEIGAEIPDNELQTLINVINATSGMDCVKVEAEERHPAAGYSLELPLPIVTHAEAKKPDLKLPSDMEKVPLHIEDRKGRPPITQEWLKEKALRVHSGKDMLAFFVRYRKFAAQNRFADWFKRLCDDRMAQIQRASCPGENEAPPDMLLTHNLDGKQEAEMREDLVSRIKALKGPDFSVLDLFVNDKGLIPYTDEQKIPIELLLEKLEELQPDPEEKDETTR